MELLEREEAFAGLGAALREVRDGAGAVGAGAPWPAHLRARTVAA
jgi:hypothetical protein